MNKIKKILMIFLVSITTCFYNNAIKATSSNKIDELFDYPDQITLPYEQIVDACNWSLVYDENNNQVYAHVYEFIIDSSSYKFETILEDDGYYIEQTLYKFNGIDYMEVEEVITYDDGMIVSDLNSGTYYLQVKVYGIEEEIKELNLDVTFSKIATYKSYLLDEMSSFENEQMKYNHSLNELILKDGCELEQVTFCGEKLKVNVLGNATIVNDYLDVLFEINDLEIILNENANLILKANSTVIMSEKLKVQQKDKALSGQITMIANKGIETAVLIAKDVKLHIESKQEAIFLPESTIDGDSLINGCDIVAISKGNGLVFDRKLLVESTKLDFQQYDHFCFGNDIEINNSEFNLSLKNGSIYLSQNNVAFKNSIINFKTKSESGLFDISIDDLNKLVIDNKYKLLSYDDNNEPLFIINDLKVLDENKIKTIFGIKTVETTKISCLCNFDGTHSIYYDGKLLYRESCASNCTLCDKDTIYQDVIESDWFFKVVMKATRAGLMKNTGLGIGQFEPNLEISRGMVATVLYRMANTPDVSKTMIFSDVKDQVWYTNAIYWASANKVVSGYKDGRFGPDENITRQDLAIMLRNFAKSKGLNTNVDASLDQFKDANQVVSYAQSAIAWCVEAKIMTGSKKADGVYLNPKANATRAECAKMFTLVNDLIN